MLEDPRPKSSHPTKPYGSVFWYLVRKGAYEETRQARTPPTDGNRPASGGRSYAGRFPLPPLVSRSAVGRLGRRRDQLGGREELPLRPGAARVLPGPGC